MTPDGAGCYHVCGHGVRQSGAGARPVEWKTADKVFRCAEVEVDSASTTGWAASNKILKGGGRGRRSVGLERMLRMYIAQQCFGLSDEGIEGAIYDSQAIRGFVGIDLTHESASDATTMLKFRRLLEKHDMAPRISMKINGHLASKGLMMREGTIVDATLIAAPPSPRTGARSATPRCTSRRRARTGTSA
jgi:IS5 family transposase